MKSDLLLSLDTTGETYSLALSSGHKILAECSGGQPRQHLVQIFPAVQLLCQQSSLTLSQLTGVAVTGGPGSFTGVRTGLLIAKTLGQALSIPIYPIDTLEALAGNAITGGSVVAALDARKGEVIWSVFQVKQGVAVPLQPNQLSRPEAFVEGLPRGCMVLGSACLACAELLPSRTDLTVLPADLWRPRAATLMRLAHQGRAVPWAQVRPDYVRPADVQVHHS
ncbi:tRNA (adenosine(37)-N6)-threonylcarbamoyltransferase complex dimerization subunit type 1 TsaB [bacterium]|nr:tRNA (adenosine(37)-N6)-threonylcarbamoyltransferase complex dimerization subunit type 1 TsaB [bacterium]